VHFYSVLARNFLLQHRYLAAFNAPLLKFIGKKPLLVNFHFSIALVGNYTYIILKKA
jgi:hypothetical protein